MTSVPDPVAKLSGALETPEVGVELRVNVVAPVIAVMVAPEGIAELPLTDMPTTKPVVLGTVIVELPLMAVAARVAPA